MEKALKGIVKMYNESSRSRELFYQNGFNDYGSDCSLKMYTLIELLTNLGYYQGKDFDTFRTKDSLGVEYWEMRLV